MDDDTRICPRCGRPVGGPVRPYCTPASCDAWEFVARFDHATRQWVPVDPEEQP